MSVAAQDVIDYLGSNYDAEGAPSLTVQLRMAASVLAKVVACASAKGITISSEDRDLLTILLAAHYYQGSDEGYASRSTSKASGSFKGQFAMRFERTTYGQDALALDSSGCLASIQSQGVGVSMFWGGKRLSDQLTYDQRN